MQSRKLTVPSILDHAARWHPEQEIISRNPEGVTVISTYADLHRRSKLCALALQGMGIG
jgi:fatty-acyl-CoA synthase